MLEQVSKAGAAFVLIARPDVVINRNRNDRHGMVLVEDDPQSVVQSNLFDWCVWNLKSFLHRKPDFPRLRKLEERRGMRQKILARNGGIKQRRSTLPAASHRMEHQNQ